MSQNASYVTVNMDQLGLDLSSPNLVMINLFNV